MYKTSIDLHSSSIVFAHHDFCDKNKTVMKISVFQNTDMLLQTLIYPQRITNNWMHLYLKVDLLTSITTSNTHNLP